MPTSAAQALQPPRSARPVLTRRGFTLIEVLVALSIVAMMAAVAVPGLARRLDTAFSDADLMQARSSAELLPARVATLGIDLELDAAALTRVLPDGYPPLDIAPGWESKVEQAARLWHSGTCEAGSLVLREPASGRRWRISVARLSCEVAVLPVDAGAP